MHVLDRETCYFQIRNWPHKLSPLVVLVRAISSKKHKLRRFKSDRDEIRRDCFLRKYASTDGVGFWIWRHNFKMAAMTPFQAEQCCHLVGAHAVYARRSATAFRQFLICSTFVHVLSQNAPKYAWQPAERRAYTTCAFSTVGWCDSLVVSVLH